MQDNPSRLVFVAGLPRGGTSCIAWTLHDLGINMEPNRTTSWPDKSYPSCENDLINSLSPAWTTVARETSSETAARASHQIERLRTYCQERLDAFPIKDRLAGFHGVGFKHPLTTLFAEGDPKQWSTLPLTVIPVVRDHYPLRVNRLRQTLLDRITRACNRMRWFFPSIPPLHYEEVIRDPTGAATYLAGVLDLPKDNIPRAVQRIQNHLQNQPSAQLPQPASSASG